MTSLHAGNLSAALAGACKAGAALHCLKLEPLNCSSTAVRELSLQLNNALTSRTYSYT